jgi:hypothetical protein
MPRMHEAELLEREHELTALDALVEATQAGDGRLLVIEGPAGIGKTRLLSGLRRSAERPLHVLAARGSELERDFAFGVVRQLFEGAVAGAGGDDRAFDGAADGARGVFGNPGSDNGDGDGAGENSFAALHGLYWLALNLQARALTRRYDRAEGAACAPVRSSTCRKAATTCGSNWVPEHSSSCSRAARAPIDLR